MSHLINSPDNRGHLAATGAARRPGRLLLAVVAGAALVGCGDSGTAGTTGPTGLPTSSALTFMPSAQSHVVAAAAITTGDFNGDTRMDVAAGGSDGTITTLVADGSGLFQAHSVAVVSGTVLGMVAVDIDRNGHVDLAVTSRDGTGGHLVILEGKGDGSFVQAADYAVGMMPVALAIADLNGDGHYDAAVVSQSDAGLAVLLGTGTGLAPPTRYTLDARPIALTVGDANSDGKPDLIVTLGGGGIGALFGDGMGGFVTGALLQLGGRATPGGFVGDVLGLSLGAIVPSGVPPNLNADGMATLVAFDADGDGSLEIAEGQRPTDQTGSPLGGIITVVTHGGGVLGRGTTFRSSVPVTSLVAGDFDGDGKVDLVATLEGGDKGGAGRLAVLKGHGDGQFDALADAGAPTDLAAAAAAADLNGDGHTDVALASTASSTVTLFVSRAP